MIRARESREHVFDRISIAVDVADEHDGAIVWKTNESRSPLALGRIHPVQPFDESGDVFSKWGVVHGHGLIIRCALGLLMAAI
jgi:hypothetical protein